MPDPVIVNDLAQPKSLGQKTSAESLPVVLPSDYAIPVDTTGLATEAKQDTANASLAAIDASTDGLEALVGSTNAKLDTLTLKVGAGFPFTKEYDELVASVDATHDYFTTKLAGVSQQVLTVTYSDATKDASTANYKVV